MMKILKEYEETIKGAKIVGLRVATKEECEEYDMKEGVVILEFDNGCAIIQEAGFIPS